MGDLPPFPSSPAPDEVLVKQGGLYQRGHDIILNHVRALSADTSMPFEIKNIQVSHSAQYQLIVRANVEWSFEGQLASSIEMLRIDTEGMGSGRGIALD